METASEELGGIHSPLTMRSDHVPQHHLENRHSATGNPEKVRKDACDSNKTEVTSDAVKNMRSDLDQLAVMNYFFPFLYSLSSDIETNKEVRSLENKKVKMKSSGNKEYMS